MIRAIKTVRERSRFLAIRLVMTGAYEKKSTLNQIWRRILSISPMIRALLLYQAGYIQRAKRLTDKHNFQNKIMSPIRGRIDEISLALTNRADFTERVGLPIPHTERIPFNQHVVMVVDSCAHFDSNGYTLRSTQIKNALEASSIDVKFCARLGYPWDMHGRGSWPVVDSVDSDEGMVWLQHDPERLVGQADSKYWNAYAGYIVQKVTTIAEKPSVLHAHSRYGNAIAAAIAGRVLGIPVVYEMRGLWHLTRAQREPTFDQSDMYRYEEDMEIWAAQIADAVVVLSHSMKSWLMERGIPDGKIRVQPNTIDVSALAEISDASHIVYSPGASRLAFMGSLTPYEGIDTVMEAMAILDKRGRPATLDIFGDGNFRRQLENLSRKLGQTRQVTFHGKVSRERALSCIHDFDIYPIVRKNSELTRLIPPLKHLEPMLAGRMVIVSKLPALMENVPELVAENAVPPEDPLALANKLEELMLNRDRLRQIGEHSRQWVKTRRNWTTNAKMYTDLYLNLDLNGHAIL